MSTVDDAPRREEPNSFDSQFWPEMEKIDLLLASTGEQLRRQRLLAGIDDEEAERLKAERYAQLPALVARMREENDALEAELTRRRRLRRIK